jgi:hypothetical protein
MAVLKALVLANSAMRALAHTDVVPKAQSPRAQCLAAAAEVLETQVLRILAMRAQVMEEWA